MSEKPRLYVLGELWQEDNEVHGALVCPNCGAQVFSGGWDGELTSFESLCRGCDTELLYFNTIVETNEYYREYGSASAEEMREFLTQYWDEQLLDGITNEREVGYEATGVIESGTYAGVPDVEPVVEEVDETELFVDEYRYRAEKFGWDWKPPEEVLE